MDACITLMYNVYETWLFFYISFASLPSPTLFVSVAGVEFSIRFPDQSTVSIGAVDILSLFVDTVEEAR